MYYKIERRINDPGGYATKVQQLKEKGFRIKWNLERKDHWVKAHFFKIFKKQWYKFTR